MRPSTHRDGMRRRAARSGESGWGLAACGAKQTHEEADEEREAAADAVDEVHNLQRRALPREETHTTHDTPRNQCRVFVSSSHAYNRHSQVRKEAKEQEKPGRRRASVYTTLQDRSTRSVTKGMASASLCLAPLSPAGTTRE